MTSQQLRRIALIAVLCVFPLSATIGQDPTASSLDPDEKESVDAGGASFDLAEDMEILATVVRDNVDIAYRAAHFQATSGDDSDALSAAHSTSMVGDALVDYLPGYGVVIQMRAPAVAVREPQPQATDDKPLSQWELTRMKLRGDLSANDQQCVDCHQVSSDNLADLLSSPARLGFHQWHSMGTTAPSSTQASNRGPEPDDLLENLIDSLIENGQHVRDLPADERVTVSVGFWISDSGANVDLFHSSGVTNPSSAEAVRDATLAAAGLGSFHQEAEDGSNTQYVIDNLIAEQLARDPDRYQSMDREDIVKRLYLDLVGTLPTDEEMQRFMNDSSEQAYARLVTRLLASENSYDDINAYLQSLLGSAQTEELPTRGRIRVTATKRQLDQVGSGQLTREEFEKLIETSIFAPPNSRPR